jgi:hypothetical protein
VVGGGLERISMRRATSLMASAASAPPSEVQ